MYSMSFIFFEVPVLDPSKFVFFIYSMLYLEVIMAMSILSLRLLLTRTKSTQYLKLNYAKIITNKENKIYIDCKLGGDFKVNFIFQLTIHFPFFPSYLYAIC